MAAPAGRTVLLSSLALLGLVGAAQAFWGGGASRPPSPLEFAEASGCVPENFTAELPETVTAASQACAPRRRFGRSPRRRGFSGGAGRHGGRHGDKATLLQCFASQLNVTNDSGVDEASLDTLLDSLSTNTTFTDQLKASADTCLASMNATLTADQQGVYVLACLKLQLATDCGRQDENATLCLNAKTLCKCPLGIQSLVSTTNWYTCKRQVMMSSIFSTISNVFGGSSSSISLDADSLCPMMEEKARSVANCSLVREGLSSDDTVDLTAVQTAIDGSSTTTDAEKALQTAALAACADSAVDAFLTCWAEQTADGCTTSSANRLAFSYTGNTDSSGGGRFRPGSGGGGRFGGRRPFGRRTRGRGGRGGRG